MILVYPFWYQLTLFSTNDHKMAPTNTQYSKDWSPSSGTESEDAGFSKYYFPKFGMAVN
jgi:hypothetical protein